MSGAVGVLVMAYGGPNKLDEVEPYLLDVRGGRPTPPPVVREVVRRYELIGGRSPILEHTQAQAKALQAALDHSDGQFMVGVGMRHWHPYIAQAVAELAEQGISRLVGLVMAPHYSRMSIGAYYKSLDSAIETSSLSMEIEAIESWKEDRGYLDALESRIHEALERFADSDQSGVHLILTAHSLPERILEWEDPYPQELQVTVERLRARFPEQPAHFAYQSAAMTREPWLGPEAGELMLDLIQQGVRDFLVIPIGFVSEHVEILYDIDIDFKGRIESAGGRLERIEMARADPRMMASLAERVRQAAEGRGWL